MPGASIVEASVEDAHSWLEQGRVTSVELVAKHLARIAAYDNRGPCLNAIPVLNKNVFEEAASSDARRASGKAIGPLDGVPFTVKDSYKVSGMTVAAGSPAFRNLVANQDAATVEALRAAGAVLIGKTNMPPMAAGGMQRGLYGRAENPYNPRYLAAAFASGSSNGSAVATAASFAIFGMAEETVSSGRSPASNNGLVAYTPSRGLLSIRGNWPLFPTCDVVVPHARSVGDCLYVLDAIMSSEDGNARGDFWREQPYVTLPRPTMPPLPSSLAGSADALQGKRIGVPTLYTGGDTGGCWPVQLRDSIAHVWREARLRLEKIGAIVVDVDFPLELAYERGNCPGNMCTLPGLPDGWNCQGRGRMIAAVWNAFLRENNDPAMSSLRDVDLAQIYPAYEAGDVHIMFSDPTASVPYTSLVDMLPDDAQDVWSIPGLSDALHMLEKTRVELFEKWMTSLNVDLVCFPANGDVGEAVADRDVEAAQHAWKNGVKYSNGNRAIRHVGIPTVSVPMGVMDDTKIPVNLTFLGKAYSDWDLFRYAYAFEQASPRRSWPAQAPPRASDSISEVPVVAWDDEIPSLVVDDACTTEDHCLIRGKVSRGASLDVYVGPCDPVRADISAMGQFEVQIGAPVAPVLAPPEGPYNRRLLVILVAKSPGGRATGRLLQI